MDIRDKTVLITGGASGLGLATARYMLEAKGARVAILDVDPTAGEAAIAGLDAERALYVQADVSGDVSVRAALDRVFERFGGVHVCINGAALPDAFRILDKSGRAVSPDRFARTMAVNVVGAFNVMSKCAELMARNEPERGEERGVIINVSSGAAFEGQVGQCAYASSKSALLGLNMPAARELGALGIRVNAIAPGLFLTAMVAALPEPVMASLREQMEAPKRLGRLEEFAHCCAFIVENPYVNGETIRLDGAARLRAR